MRPHKYQQSPGGGRDGACRVCGSKLIEHTGLRASTAKGRVTHPLGLSRRGGR